MNIADLVETAKSKESIIQGLTSDLAHSKKDYDELKSSTKVQYDALVEKVGKMKKELKQEVQEATDKHKAAEKQVNEEKSKSSGLQNEVDELNQKLKLLQKTAQMPKGTKNEDDDDDEDDEITQLKEQIDEMSDKNIELSRARKKDFDQIKLMNEEKNVLKAKIDELTRKLASQTKNNESTGEAEQLKVQLEQITMKNLELTKKCSTDIETIRLIIEERNVLNVRVEELHIRYVTITKTVEDLEQQKALLYEQNNQMHKDANSNASNANAQLEFVKKQLEDFSNIALSLTKKEQKSNQLQEQRDRLNKEQEDLNQQHKSNEKSQQNNEKFQQDNQKLNNQINALNTQLNETTIEELKKLVDEKNNLEYQVRSLNEQSKGLGFVIQKQADQTETTQRQMDDFTAETLTLTSSSDLDDKEIKSIIEERDKLLKLINELTLKYKEMDKNGPNSEHESKEFMVQSELLKTQVDDLNQRILEQTLSNIKKIQAERNSLKKQLEAMAGDGAHQNKFFTDQLDELKKLNDLLTQECKTSKNQNVQYLKEIELLKQQIEELKERILELTSALDKEQRSNKDLTKQVDELSNQIKEILAKAENDEEESQQSKILRIQNNELNAKHQSNVKNIKKLNEDIDNLKFQLQSENNGQQEIQNLNDKVNQLNLQMATDYDYLMKILAEMSQLKQKLANGDNNISRSNLQSQNKSATPSHRKSTKSFATAKTLNGEESFASQFNQDGKKDQLNLKIWRY